MNEDDAFFAWLDGELSGEAAERVAARVAASPELTARAEQHRKLRSGLRGAFDPIMVADAPVPRFDRAEIFDFGARATERRRSWLAVPQWAAMAATLAVGVITGVLIADRGGTDSPVAVEGGRLIATASLDQALDTRLASAPISSGPRIGLTFRNASGQICRSFRAAPATGLACRDGEQWQIRGMFQSGEGQTADYRMAAGEDPRLAALIDEMISGEPFDADQEKAALEKGWR